MKHLPPDSHCLRIIPAVLAVLATAYSPNQAVATERIVELTHGAAPPGSQTQIELRISDLAGFAGGDFRLMFDPAAIALDNAQLALATSGFFIADDLPEPGVFAVSLASVEGLATSGEGAIVTLTVSSLPTAPPGTLVPIVFLLARWYDEDSVRYRLLADNGLFLVGASAPPDEDLVLSVGSNSGVPSQTVYVPLTVSMAEGIAEVSGELEFDLNILESALLVPTSPIGGWQQEIQYSDGRISFDLSGDEGLHGLGPVQLGWFSFRVSPSTPLRSLSPLDLSDAEVRSLRDCPFLCTLRSGVVSVGEEPSAVGNWRLYDSGEPR